MDPNLFALDYERLFEVLAVVVVLSLFIERALSVLFETRWFVSMYEAKPNRKGIKEVIALIVSVAACFYWNVDAVSTVIVAHENMTVPGYLLTGAIVAGGGKGSIKLFRDVFGFMSSAEQERQAVKKAKLAKLQGK